VMNNARSDAMTNSIFLAQQQIDFLRNLSADELHNLSLSPIDELMDINSDGTVDYRRITQLASSGFYWNVRVMVFQDSRRKWQWIILSPVLPNIKSELT
jgi:hypothetical protein